MTSTLRKEIEAAVSPLNFDCLAVAVSGGSDSLALLYLLAETAREHLFLLHAVTVDHGLRDDAAAEADYVKSVCRDLQVPHDTLHWTDWDGRGNVQSEARNARYGLIAEWAQSLGIETVALGHTINDQAETFVMRLARESGVDGLSGMAGHRRFCGVNWIRPLLKVEREDLRRYLSEKGVDWVDDPSNADERFERVRVRKQLELLADLGISANTLAQVASNMRSAKDAISHQALTRAKEIGSEQVGAICFDWRAFQETPVEIQRRLLVVALAWLSGTDYPPRRSALDAARKAVEETGAATLDGCLWRIKQNSLWLCRELNAVEHTSAKIGELWDGRWKIEGPDVCGTAIVKALGPVGLAECPEWREKSLPRDALLSGPAVWKGEKLLAAPLINQDTDWKVILMRGKEDFFDAVISH